jgi:hypothetical protein
VLTTAFLVGCSPEEERRERAPERAAVEPNDQSSAATDAPISQQPEAQFRRAARELYGSLFQPSCEPLPGFSRDVMLSDDREEVSGFEQFLRGTPGSLHVGIAKADAALEEGCWLDDEPKIALRHVNMTKEEVSERLEEMRALAPRLRPVKLASGSASAGAEFRRGVRRLIWAIGPQCPIVDGAPNEQVLAPARERVSQFERELAGSEFAEQFEIAKADAEFERSTTLDICLVPEPLKLELATEKSLRNVEQQISELEAFMGR